MSEDELAELVQRLSGLTAQPEAAHVDFSNVAVTGSTSLRDLNVVADALALDARDFRLHTERGTVLSFLGIEVSRSAREVEIDSESQDEDLTTVVIDRNPRPDDSVVVRIGERFLRVMTRVATIGDFELDGDQQTAHPSFADASWSGSQLSNEGWRLPTEQEWDACIASGLEPSGFWEWTTTPHRSGHVVRGGRWRDRAELPPQASNRSWETGGAGDVVARYVMEIQPEDLEEYLVPRDHFAGFTESRRVFDAAVGEARAAFAERGLAFNESTIEELMRLDGWQDHDAAEYLAQNVDFGRASALRGGLARVLAWFGA